MAMAMSSTSPSVSGQLLLQVSAPRMGCLGGGTHQRSLVSVAVGGPARPGQQPVEGSGGGGGKVHASPRMAIMAVGGPTMPYQLPAEGTSGGGGKAHATPRETLMVVGGHWWWWRES
jgi:hypothetical protein